MQATRNSSRPQARRYLFLLCKPLGWVYQEAASIRQVSIGTHVVDTKGFILDIAGLHSDPRLEEKG